MPNFGWDYPPGVTGREFAIAGPGYERDYLGDCPLCGEQECLVEQGYRTERWVVCSFCDFLEGLPDKDEYDNPEIP